jgi:hypothetical protein
VYDIASRAHYSSSREEGDDPSEELEDDNALFEELENDDDDLDIGGLREKRLEMLKAELDKAKNMRESDHGRLTEITDEKEVIRTSA